MDHDRLGFDGKGAGDAVGDLCLVADRDPSAPNERPHWAKSGLVSLVPSMNGRSG